MALLLTFKKNGMTTKKIKRSYLYIAQSENEEVPQTRLPLGNAIRLLGSNIDYDTKPDIPQPGYRPVTIQQNASSEKSSCIEVSEGDWLVVDVCKFTGDAEEVYFCYCQHSPVEKNWKRVPRTEELLVQGLSNPEADAISFS